jgi:hypothetical protein
MGESALDKLPEDESCSKPVFNAVPARIQSMTRAEPEGAAADKVEAKVRNKAGSMGCMWVWVCGGGGGEWSFVRAATVG